MSNLKRLKKEFKNKKILITGHTGFKGSWLSLYFHLFGSKVYGISDQVPTKPSHYQFIKKIFKGDYKFNLSDSTKTEKIINKLKPDYIFHLAAQSIVSKSKTHPIETLNSNIMGSSNVLNAVKNFKRKIVIIMITSDKVYKNNEWDWGYREIDRLGGDDMYSASKAATELIINSFEKFIIDNNQVKIGVARAGNVIGGGDWTKDRIIPDLIKAWRLKKKLMLNNPKAIRPWQHVLEPLLGYINLSLFLADNRNQNYANKYNFGPSTNKTFDVQKLISTILLELGDVNISKTNRSFKEHNLLRLDSSSAQKYLNWETILNFEDMCKLTSSWYKNFYSKEFDILDYSIQQVRNYLEKNDNSEKKT